MKSGRLGTPDTVAHIRQFPPVGYELASYQGSPWLWADGKPLIDLLDATIDWLIDDDGSRWIVIVIDTECLRQHVAHYALLSADTWRQRLLDAGVEVD
ncbi:hypothetical protein AXW80_23230 (plasmid) [Aeromonas salmonicida subsp. salmonicida]|uniref:hypothetical protein n=1 Tax=Aeromonas salmonicida TaxID=645 RepID=UPI0022A94FA1|nr:hypothetical protein [Aeromonas salmonicida]UYZ32428.1 hypothetical protein AXW80_23230 [Aeromonas salmonicida subsp. salmonicida]